MSKLYSLYDEKSMFYGPIFEAVSDGAAARIVTDVVNDRQSMVSKYPGDFKLYCFGDFSQSTGEFVLFDKPYYIAVCSEYVLGRALFDTDFPVSKLDAPQDAGTTNVPAPRKRKPPAGHVK